MLLGNYSFSDLIKQVIFFVANILLSFKKKFPIYLVYRERTMLNNPSLVGQMSEKSSAYQNKYLIK